MDPNIDSSISEHELFERLGSKETVDLDPHINNVFHLNEFVDHPTQPISHLPITPSIDYSESHSSPQVQSVDSRGLNSNSTRFSQYKPGAKPRRLGRPRKQQQNLPSPSHSSTRNLKKAITSKFRFDNQPLEGPGSRGGKTIRSIPRGKIVDMKRQSTLPFQVKEEREDVEKKDNDSETNNDNEEVIVIGSQPKTTEKKVDVERDEIDDNEKEEVKDEKEEIKDEKEKEVKDVEKHEKEVDKDEKEDGIEEIKEEKKTSARPKRARKPVVKEVIEEAPKKATEKVSKTKKKPEPKKTEPKKSEPKKNESKKNEPKKNEPKKSDQKTDQKTANGNSKKRTKPAESNSVKKPKSQASKLVSTSRTTVLNTSHKISRQLPGPLVGLFYDLYDDNVIQASQNAKAAAEKVALGYPVKKSPYASDILFIIEFLNKFNDVIGFDYIGPQDIEKGLSLPHNQESTNESKESESKESNYNPNYVSPKMKRLFMKLMGLVLNRKRDVTSQSSAIMELKSSSVSLGLPAEWREQIEEEEEDIEAESPVDPSVAADAGFTKVFLQDYKVKFNPFTSLLFEQKGLEVLEPKDRLVTLRILIQWALSASDAIKGHITQISQKIDLPGDKETYYAARSVLKGFKNATDAKVEAEAKFQKREDDVKYIDPTSDPLEHCFRIRLHEQLAGDIGFHVGRFYLCRMANKHNGGLTSVKKMGSVWSGPAASEPASDFKLYVQDVHSMLVQSLSNEDIDSTSKGTGKDSATGHDNWYEVASTVQELASFVNFLSQRLGITGTNDDDVIPMTSTIYKPVMYLYGYLSGLLPLLIKQESIEAYSNKDGRASRQRDINYSDKKNSQYFEEEEEEDEYDDDDEEEYKHEDAKEHEEDEEYYD